MNIILYGLACLCVWSQQAADLFASAEENMPLAPSFDSFESSTSKVSPISNDLLLATGEPIRKLFDAADTNAKAFMLKRPGTGYTLGFATENCNSELTTVPLNTSSYFQMWKYDSTTGKINSIACPDKLIKIDYNLCESVTVIDKGSVTVEDVTSFTFENAPDLSDDETSGFTITSPNTAACNGKVLSDGSSDAGIGNAITMRDDGEGNKNEGWLLINLSPGENYFYVLREFHSENLDANYAASISMSTTGEFIAISGSESDSDDPTRSRGFVKLYDSSKKLLHEFFTEYVDQVAPIVNVVISGNGETLAIGAVFPTVDDPGEDSGNSPTKSGVQLYDLTDGKQYGEIGSIINAGEMGDLPGLRLDLSKDGSRLIVGGRNYSGDKGRVRMYFIDTNKDEPVTEVFRREGDAGDHLGSSVSTSSTGRYIAVGGTGIRKSATDSRTGAVSVFDINRGAQVGDAIYGLSASDATGFSVDLVEIGDDLYVAVASIFSDKETENIFDRGKVEIYKLPSNSDAFTEWEKVGKSLYGDRGATLDFENGKYHIGDSFGFSLGLVQTEDLSLRVAVGSPFFSNVRESDAYYGVVKLFELHADGEWGQIAYDLVGISKTSASGTSIALVNGGETLAIGGGPDSKGSTSQGSVVIYAQDETSSKPSSVPSKMPSRKPSSVPSSRPSSAPSQHPSNMPSARPSVSHEPSSQPSDFRNRQFMILSKFKKLTDLDMGQREDQNWCLERVMVANPGDGSPLKMRPCETGEIKQMWSYHKQKKVIASLSGEISEETATGFCIARSGRQLVSMACTGIPENVDTIISDKALNLSQDDSSTGWISMKTGNNEFYFAIDSIRIFSRVKLLKSGTENSSYDKWQLRYHGPSEFPSSIPSSNPSSKPSVWENVALNKPTSQSSNYQGNNHFGGSKGVDGDRRPESVAGLEVSITHTAEEYEPWWFVDLEENHHIHKVVIYNREIDYSGYRLNKFRLEILLLDPSTGAEPVYFYVDTTPTNGDYTGSPGNVVTINIPDNTVGRFVKISLPGRNDFLHFREVEVF